MPDWTSQKFILVLELAGATAVLLGLVFVGLELRQNTSSMQAATMQSMVDASENYLLLMATDPDLNRIWRKGTNDLSSLSEDESSRLFFLVRAQWLRFQNGYQQWRRGTLSSDDWAFYEAFICGRSASTTKEIRRKTWNAHGPALTVEFVKFVESCWAITEQLEN